MQNLNEITEQNLEKLKQAEHRQRLKMYEAKRREKKRRNALVYKVGEIVLSCWPWVARLKVYRTREENEVEFAPLRELLLEVAADCNFTANSDFFQYNKTQ